MTNENFSYRDYVTDRAFLEDYNVYQARYAEQIRESDKVLVSLVGHAAGRSKAERPRVLDIGCSTGNLLRHLKNMVPGPEYVGGDLAESSLAQCRTNPALDGISFETLDVTDLPTEAYDVVVVNAVLYMFDEVQYDRALSSIAGSLRSGGTAIIYDFAHPFEHQNITIDETSLMHPNGLRLCLRPMKYIAEHMRAAGFAEPEFHPFELPIDLARPAYDEEVVTYTVKDDKDRRMMFRGVLFQPWCHIVARKLA